MLKQAILITKHYGNQFMKQQGRSLIFLFREGCVNMASTIHKNSVTHPEAALEKQHLQFFWSICQSQVVYQKESRHSGNTTLSILGLKRGDFDFHNSEYENNPAQAPAWTYV